jgi:hypothetical protein
MAPLPFVMLPLLYQEVLPPIKGKTTGKDNIHWTAAAELNI